MADRTRQHIGFIGIGHMGEAMAGVLLEAGYPVTAWNRTREDAERLIPAGARVAPGVGELTDRADVVVSSLADDDAVMDVYAGPDGVLGHARPGQVLVETSTISPRTVRDIAEAARTRGARYLDAAVSGSVPQARSRELVFMVGGDHGAYESVSGILDTLGRRAFYMGESGTGCWMKLVVNTLLGVTIEGLAEAAALGEKAGLDTRLLMDVLGDSGVGSPLVRSRADSIVRHEFPASFPIYLMEKDFHLILDAAHRLRVPMPATAAAAQVCIAETGKGREEDAMAVFRTVEGMALPGT